jgi:aryl-alcohol dehydrogenase-like predicted oxidoreductase
MNDRPAMPQRRLGTSGLLVGAVGLGCMGMSWAYGARQRDDQQSIAVIHRAIELGATLIDTADIYGPFTNERLVGRALHDRRDQVVLATKCGLVVDDPATFAMHRDGSPAHLRQAIEASLQRLNVDEIDLYQLHRVDEKTPLEESWGAIAELVTAGTVRAIGLSEVSVDELQRAHAIHPVTSVQSELSLWTRDPLAEVLPWCKTHDVAFIPFAPLGRGYLTGTITSSSFDDDDFRARNPRFTPEALANNLAILERVKRVAERQRSTLAQVALAWVLAQGTQVVPIPGTRHLGRVEENTASAHIQLTPEDLAELDDAPTPAGRRY